MQLNQVQIEIDELKSRIVWLENLNGDGLIRPKVFHIPVTLLLEMTEIKKIGLPCPSKSVFHLEFLLVYFSLLNLFRELF